MGGPYNIPRNVKGEGRILFIFTTKSFIYSIATGVVGIPFYIFLNAAGMTVIGIGVVAFFALIGFTIGTFKFPEIASLAFTKKVGGENVDEVIKRAMKFKRNKKIYIYKEDK